MARAPHSVARKARHNKWLKRAKGFRTRRSSTFKVAKEAVIKAGQHAYNDRRKKKATFRAVWQIRINAAARMHGVSYSKLIAGLRKHEIAIDRKILSELAAEHPAVFEQIVKAAVAE